MVLFASDLSFRSCEILAAAISKVRRTTTEVPIGSTPAWQQTPSDAWEIPPPSLRPRRRRTGIHLVLFAATFASTFAVYATSSGRITHGLEYALAIMAILTAHEMGHFLTCRRYGVPATLPYFIPFPITLFGTMGAVIKMQGPIYSRRALFDIAVAGPVAGLVVAVPALAFGLAHSQVIPGLSDAEESIRLGEPLLLRWLADRILGPLPPDHEILLRPAAFAGWAGLFVTALNLLPAGQLDGGHIVHAMVGRKSRMVTVAVVAGLIVITALTGFLSWLLIAALIALFGFRHAPVVDDGATLDARRILIGVAMLIVFVLCFTPVPISLS